VNIIFITNNSALYGANRSLLLLLKGLKQKNINPLVFVSKEGPLLKELQKLNIPYRKVRFWAWLGVRNNIFVIKILLRFLLNLFAMPYLVICAMKFKPSLIYTNSSTTPIGIYLALIMRLPHIWHIRELGKLDYNLDYDFGRKYFNYFMRKSDAVICISEFVRSNIFMGDWKNVSVINNAVNSGDEVNQLNVEDVVKKNEAFTFLIMSIVHPSKGIHDVIEALGRIKNEHHETKLIICGGDEDKSYRKYLNDLVVKLDLVERVVFMGFVDKPTEMYEISDAVLVCSRNEAWGRVSAEAMIFGKPVIGYNSGGTREIITDNLNGLLYNNIEELVSCMKTVIFDEELVKKMTINAKKSVLEKYNNTKYVENVFKVISKLVKN